MKISTMMILAVVGTMAQAQTITVYIRRDVNDPNLRTLIAKGIASGMFAKAGVRIDWRTDPPQPQQIESAIVINVVSNAPGTLRPGALASAQVFEGVHIGIFWDRVQERAGGDPLLTNKLLAHVMVHEITHLLQGQERHSVEGVMKAQWTPGDIAHMIWKPMPFEHADIELIRAPVSPTDPARYTDLTGEVAQVARLRNRIETTTTTERYFAVRSSDRQ